MKKRKDKVFVVGPEGFITNMFEREGWEIVGTPEKADVLCFTGGADINPDLYGERCHPATWFDPVRDREDMHIYDTNQDKFKVGICRGGQFLNVMSGGTMYQDVDYHAISGTHMARDTRSGQILAVTSTHHQMMVPDETSGCVLLTAKCSTRRETAYETILLPFDSPDTEAVWYKHTKSVCFQPHPEYPEGRFCRPYFFELIKEFRDVG